MSPPLFALQGLDLGLQMTELKPGDDERLVGGWRGDPGFDWWATRTADRSLSNSGSPSAKESKRRRLARSLVGEEPYE